MVVGLFEGLGYGQQERKEFFLNGVCKGDGANEARHWEAWGRHRFTNGLSAFERGLLI